MLNTAFEFKRKCESSDVKLRSCVKNNLKVEDEDEADHYFDFPDNDLFATEYQDDDSKTFSMEVDVKLFEPNEVLLVEKKIKKKKKWKPLSECVGSHSRGVKKSKKFLPTFLQKVKVVSNNIATSLLEGKCSWNGSDWR
jgi:hypothetical protein